MNFVRCRCGATHQPRERSVKCCYCGTPTWDHHGCCARCRGAEALEKHANDLLELVDAVALDDAEESRTNAEQLTIGEARSA